EPRLRGADLDAATLLEDLAVGRPEARLEPEARAEPLACLQRHLAAPLAVERHAPAHDVAAVRPDVEVDLEAAPGRAARVPSREHDYERAVARAPPGRALEAREQHRTPELGDRERDSMRRTIARDDLDRHGPERRRRVERQLEHEHAVAVGAAGHRPAAG